MRPVLIALITLLSFGLQASRAAGVTSETQPDGKPYSARNYRHSLIGKGAAVKTGASAAWGEMVNHPHEWGRGVGGFGKRLASGFAGHAVGSSIEYGVGHMLHEQVHYQRSEDPSFHARLHSAFKNTFLVYHRGSTKQHPAVGRISGAVGAGLISRLWQPASTRTIAAGFGSAGTSLGVQFGINMAREYFPRHNHRIEDEKVRGRK